MLIAITALIHNYLLVMVGAIWASAMVERFVHSDRRGRIVLAGGSAAILAMVAGIALLLGAGEPHVPAGNYGAFAMPLDALWNPGNPAFSLFMPAIEQRPGRGFEGFQYLGLGLLLLLVLAAALARRCRADPAQEAAFGRLRWLIPALVVLTLLAISNYPDIAGHRLPRFALPAFVAPLLDMVRASGRLFWPVAYVLVLAGVLVAYRLPRRRAGLVLAALLAIQMVDLSGMLATVRAESTEAGAHRLYVRTPDPRWEQVVASARDVTFVPPDATRDLALFQEVAWRAASLRRPMRLVYAARNSLATTARLRAEQAAFARGELAPGRLYVLAPGIPVPAAAAHRAAMLDGVSLILPENGALVR